MQRVCLVSRSPTFDKGKTSLVALLPCFSSFYVEPQFMSLGFYDSCYSIIYGYGSLYLFPSAAGGSISNDG